MSCLYQIHHHHLSRLPMARRGPCHVLPVSETSPSFVTTPIWHTAASAMSCQHQIHHHHLSRLPYGTPRPLPCLACIRYITIICHNSPMAHRGLCHVLPASETSPSFVTTPLRHTAASAMSCLYYLIHWDQNSFYETDVKSSGHFKAKSQC